MIGTHSRAWSLAWISTPGLEPSRNLPIRSARTVFGTARRVAGRRARALLVQEIGQRRSAPRRRHDPRPGVRPVRVRAVDQALRLRLERRRHLRRGGGERAGGVLGQQHADRLAVDLDAQRQVGAGPVDELDGDAVAALMAPGGRAHDDRRLSGPADRRLRLALVAVRLVLERHDLGDVRVLLRDLLEARVDLLRRLVVVDEVVLVAGQLSSAASRPPASWRPCRSPRRPCCDATRIRSGCVATLNRLRWNMYTPESTKRLIARAEMNSVPGPLVVLERHPDRSGSSARPGSCAPRRRGSPGPWS